MVTVNTFAGYYIDRCAERRKDAEWLRDALTSERARFVPLWQDRHLVSTNPPAAALLPRGDILKLVDSDGEWVMLGTFRGHPCFAIALPDHADTGALATHGEFMNLRKAAMLTPAGDGALLAYARAMLLWHAAHRYCGTCGERTLISEAGHVRRCRSKACGRAQFPVMYPAVIVLVRRGERCLLGRQASWPKDMYSAVAGFAEPGESLEDAVAREVGEETNIRVTDVRYHSSQPWPFPASLMLGFTARATSEEIHCNDKELEDARWFTRADLEARAARGLPGLPYQLSIAFRLVSHWYDPSDPGALAARIAPPRAG